MRSSFLSFFLIIISFSQFSVVPFSLDFSEYVGLVFQEILDKQFVQMEELEDVHNPNFAEELMTLYFRDSSKLLISVEKAL